MSTRLNIFNLRRNSRRLRYLRYAILIFVFLNFLEVWHIQHNLSQSSIAYGDPKYASIKAKRIYIASIHWNNEAILRERWNDAVIELVKTFGPKNVFISIYESGSWDDTKGALRELEYQLNKLDVPRNITFSDTTHIDEISAPPTDLGWIETPRKKKELRRIPYLSRLRNISLQPLLDLHSKGSDFDSILFLGDVAFTNNDIFELLNTNNGKYAAACSLDFSKPPLFYDTFALRDAEGHERVMQTWPYFRSKTSRHALKDNIPVPVSSCWNGIVAMPTEPFVSATGLKFRGIDDSLAMHHLEGSECCLIHADNPASVSKGVFLNPKVRVGYNIGAYEGVNPGGSWLSSWQILLGLWENRFSRWFTTSWFKEWVVGRRLRNWRSQNLGVDEPGQFCLINEMQVLVENGWKHL